MSKAHTPFNWITLGLLVAAGFLLLWSSHHGGVQAQGGAHHAGRGLAAAINTDKPQARAHIIMQVNDPEPSHYKAALTISNNLIGHYRGADRVDIEIIAFGAGVPMLTVSNNAEETRIRSLMENGVRFYICANTLDSITRQTGTRPLPLAGVKEVPSGVAFMVEEMARGYHQVHP